MSLTNLQVVELQRAVAAQKLATETQAAAAVQAKIDEKVAEELKKVAPSNLRAQAVQPNKKKKYGGGGLSSSRSGHSSQGARRRAKHAERTKDPRLFAYQEAYEIVNGAASELNGARGYSRSVVLLPLMAWQAGLRVTGWGSTNAIRRIACPLLETSHTRAASPSGEVFTGSRQFLAPAMRPMSQ